MTICASCLETIKGIGTNLNIQLGTFCALISTYMYNVSPLPLKKVQMRIRVMANGIKYIYLYIERYIDTDRCRYVPLKLINIIQAHIIERYRYRPL